MAIIEACVPWEPIPERFNTNWTVDVVHLEEAYTSESRSRKANLSIAIAAYSEPHEGRQRENGAWRIDFLLFKAYQMRTINYPGSLPLTRPDTTSAFWEITPSRFAEESGVLGASPGREVHHYIIVAAMHTAYEIVAEGWHCEPLPEEWARPFSPDPFPGW